MDSLLLFSPKLRPSISLGNQPFLIFSVSRPLHLPFPSILPLRSLFNISPSRILSLKNSTPPLPNIQPSTSLSVQLSPTLSNQLSLSLSIQLSPSLRNQLSPSPSTQVSPSLNIQPSMFYRFPPITPWRILSSMSCNLCTTV